MQQLSSKKGMHTPLSPTPIKKQSSKLTSVEYQKDPTTGMDPDKETKEKEKLHPFQPRQLHRHLQQDKNTPKSQILSTTTPM